MLTVLKILIGLFVGVWALVITVIWVGMFLRIGWLAMCAYRKHGLKAFKVSIRGNPFNDLG